jgi:hypothetical protein
MKKLMITALVLVVSLLAITSVASAEHGDIGGLTMRSYSVTIQK